jgi:hypothetical protein
MAWWIYFIFHLGHPLYVDTSRPIRSHPEGFSVAGLESHGAGVLRMTSNRPWLEALKPLKHRCAVVMVTTVKVYANREWDYGYREEDRLGGHDPYSASKAAAELAIASWRLSFCG